MKKTWKAVLLGLSMILSVGMSSVALAREAEVQLNGQQLDFTDAEGNVVKAQIMNNRTMVPLRKIFEVLGCEITWDGENEIVTATKGDTQIVLQIDEVTATKTVSGRKETISLDTAPVIYQNRTLVPLRFVAESLEKQVGWEASTYTAIIIDYDALANSIREKNEAWYQVLTSHAVPMTYRITESYEDLSNTSRNHTATLQGTIQSDGNVTKVEANFSGTDELMQEIASEGWDQLTYEIEAKEDSLKIQTSHAVLQRILEQTAGTQKTYSMKQLQLTGSPKDDFATYLRKNIGVADNEVTSQTFASLQKEVEDISNIFFVNGTRTLTNDNTTFAHWDVFDFENSIYQQDLWQALTFLNRTIFLKTTTRDEFFYDWNTIQYTVNGENNHLVLKLVLQNEYNEKVEYEVEIQVAS